MMIYDIDWLRRAAAEGTVEGYVFFWGHKPSAGGEITKSCLSQWWECSFTSEGVSYCSAEQYMMAGKARLFGDKETLKKIMAAREPGAIKSLGRQVRGFDETVWSAHCRDIIVAGNLAKFFQNEELKGYLLSTGDKVLAEASPYDRIWGIGMAEEDPRCRDPFSWKGTDLLGFCLMEVRDRLKEI